MFDSDKEKPSADYLLRAMAIMKSMDAGANLISEISYATALPVTTVIRTAAILADDQIIKATLVGSDVELSFIHRGRPPQPGT